MIPSLKSLAMKSRTHLGSARKGIRTLNSDSLQFITESRSTVESNDSSQEDYSNYLAMQKAQRQNKNSKDISSLSIAPTKNQKNLILSVGLASLFIIIMLVFQLSSNIESPTGSNVATNQTAINGDRNATEKKSENDSSSKTSPVSSDHAKRSHLDKLQNTISPTMGTPSPSCAPSVPPPPKYWTQVGHNINASKVFDRFGEITSISSIRNNAEEKAKNDISQHIRVAIVSNHNEHKNNTEQSNSYNRVRRKRELQKDSISVGIVQVYELKGNLEDSSWVQLGSDLYGETTFGSRSAMALSGDGNTITFGSRGHLEASILAQILVFRCNDLSQWEQIGDFNSPEIREVSSISSSLTYDGNRIIVGETTHSSFGGEQIKLKVFDFVKSNVWQQVGDTLLFDSTSDTTRNRARVPNHIINLSTSISLTGHRIAVGVLGKDFSFMQVLEYYNNGKWRPLMPPIPSKAHDISLSGDGEIFAIGIPTATDIFGQVRIYRVKKKGVWHQLGETLTAPIRDSSAHIPLECFSYSDNFGYSVSLSSSGHRIAIGAPGKCQLQSTNHSGGLQGEVYVYDYKSEKNSWRLMGEDEFSGNIDSNVNILKGDRQGDQCGYSVSLSSDGEMLVVGSVTSDVGGFDGGDARVYRYM